jgi:hypothetical protein
VRCAALVVVCAALAFAGAARAAELPGLVLAPTDDVSFPFWCDWGYDWTERCYRLSGARLGVGGGEPDKVWRSALRFSTSAIPAGATVVTAELSLWYDGTCVAPRRQSRPCDGRGFGLGLHPIFTPRWSGQREVEVGPQVGFASLEPFARAQWVTWDITDLVADWVSGGLENDGVLIKLVDGEEAFDVSGPLFPSSRFLPADVRPRLTVWYVR